MASSTNKKVYVLRFDREPAPGFVSPATYLRPAGVELLHLTGTVSLIPYADIKLVRFVRDFETPGAPSRKSFLSRPKMDGLWVRLVFRDQDTLEGVLPNNLLQLESLGFTVTPPDFSYTNQRIFVPKPALTELQVLGVIGSPLRKPKPSPKDQISLFD